MAKNTPYKDVMLGSKMIMSVMGGIIDITDWSECHMCMSLLCDSGTERYRYISYLVYLIWGKLLMCIKCRKKLIGVNLVELNKK